MVQLFNVANLPLIKKKNLLKLFVDVFGNVLKSCVRRYALPKPVRKFLFAVLWIGCENNHLFADMVVWEYFLLAKWDCPDCWMEMLYMNCCRLIHLPHRPAYLFCSELTGIPGQSMSGTQESKTRLVINFNYSGCCCVISLFIANSFRKARDYMWNQIFYVPH